MEMQCKCPSCEKILGREELAVAHMKGFACQKCRIKLINCNGVLLEV